MDALADYNTQAADLHAGRKPKPQADGGSTVKDLANKYMAAQEEKAKRGIITLQWYEDCLKVIKAFLKAYGSRPWDDLRPEDFGQYRMRLYDKYGVCTIDRAMTVIRSLFKFAYDTDLIDRPIKYGDQFKKPSAKEKRISRARKDRANGKRLFTPEQIRKLHEKVENPLRAMILLGINGGFGNTDCAELPMAAVDLNGAVIDYERSKTGVQRVVPLWPETVAALQESVKKRPAPEKEEHGSLVFITRFGKPWKRVSLETEDDGVSPRVGRVQPVAAEFGKLLRKLKYRRHGLGFYALRHTFRTWADEAKDQHAVHRIMGHALPGMSGVYVEEVSLDRLRAVTDYVRRRVFPPEPEKPKTTTTDPESNPSPPSASDAAEQGQDHQAESRSSS